MNIGAEIILASHNTGKVREFAELLQPINITVHSAGSLGLPEPEETGVTFEENALLKARAATLATGKPALSDDSGLCVPAIGGAPGIYSARWTGPDKSYAAAFSRIQKELAAAKAPANPHAYFICMLALTLPDGTSHTFEGRVDGTLTFPPRGHEGFGYDPIFIPEKFDMTFGEMAAAAKHALSHRARATTRLLAFLKDN